MITAKTFTTLFLILLPLKLLIQLYLSHRNQKHIWAHQGSVPNPFTDKITLDEHQKAANYTRAKSKFGFYNLIFDAAILFVWIQGGVLNSVDLWISQFSENEIIRGLALFATIGLVGLVINLPWQIYSTFVLEEKFGFNKTTPKLFVMDMIKQLILSAVIAIPLLWGILAMMKGLGDYWWIWGWGFLTAFQFLLLWAYPTIIAPIFNKFSALEDAKTKESIEELLKNIDFAHNGIFVMDASKRSSHGNAYFTGFGKAKRIVFF
jgi:STE24 endopeptidase